MLLRGQEKVDLRPERYEICYSNALPRSIEFVFTWPLAVTAPGTGNSHWGSFDCCGRLCKGFDSQACLLSKSWSCGAKTEGQLAAARVQHPGNIGKRDEPMSRPCNIVECSARKSRHEGNRVQQEGRSSRFKTCVTCHLSIQACQEYHAAVAASRHGAANASRLH